MNTTNNGAEIMNMRDTATMVARVSRVQESLAARGITYSTVRGYHFKGETFAVKSILKANGFKWDSLGHCWSRTDEAVYRDCDISDLASEILRGLK